jgi:hypothetical protein
MGIRTMECLGEMKLGQQVGILDKYVADRPELWHYEIGDLADIALSKACHTWGDFSMPIELRGPCRPLPK